MNNKRELITQQDGLFLSIIENISSTSNYPAKIDNLLQLYRENLENGSHVGPVLREIGQMILDLADGEIDRIIKNGWKES